MGDPQKGTPNIGKLPYEPFVPSQEQAKTEAPLREGQVQLRLDC